jgi:DNA-binding response OmpR family regulator
MFNHKVMIVDTNKKFSEDLEETLAFSGYDTIVTQDPYSVLDIVSREKPHTILLDLKMPGKSGFQVAHELKSSLELQHIPIIAMTEFFKEGYKNLMDMCGIKKCLKKPFNPLDVITEIEAVREQKSESI